MTRFHASALVGGLLSLVTIPVQQQTASRPPLSVVFLYDLTISVTNSQVDADPQFKKVTDTLARQLEPDDSLRFGVVANHLILSDPLTPAELSQFSHVAPVVSDTDRFGPTPLWDELDAAVTALESDTGRRSIVVVTDGRSTANVHSVGELIDHAKAAHVSISAVAEDSLMRRPGTKLPVDPADTLASIASATGGAFQLDDGKNPRDLAGQVAWIFGVLRGGQKSAGQARR